MVVGPGRDNDRRQRWIAAGIAAAGLLLGVIALRPIDSERPATVAVSAERRVAVAAADHLSGPTPTTVRRPVAGPAGVTDQPLAAPGDVSHAYGWVADLADDDVRWNAHDAVTKLRRIGQPALPALSYALSSNDLQQRFYVEGLMRELDAKPTPILLEVVIEGLRADRHRQVSWELDRVASRLRYLQEHPLAARRPLYAALGSDDRQQRFLSAYLLARGGHAASAAHTCPLLIEHLADNQIRSDALLSAHALYRLGEAALPHVRRGMARADAQATRLLRLVELDIVDPPRTAAALRARRQLHSASSVYFDPVIELQVGRTPVPRIRH